MDSWQFPIYYGFMLYGFGLVVDDMDCSESQPRVDTNPKMVIPLTPSTVFRLLIV